MALFVWAWLRPVAEGDGLFGLAERLSGSTHFRVELRDERIGRLDTEIRIETAAVRLASRLETALPGAEPVEVDETFVFAATAPFALARAERVERHGARERRVTIVPGPAGYTARIASEGTERLEALQWQYDLARHLALESWLASHDPGVGATLATDTFDFERLGPAPAHYVVTGRTGDGGWMLRSTAAGDGRILAIAADLLPRALSTGDAFMLVRTAEPASLALRTRTHAPDVRVPLAAAIDRPARAVQLTLAADARTLAALGADATKDRLTIDAHAERASTVEARDAALASSIALPIASAQIRTLLERVPRADDPRAQVAALLEFVRRSLVYDDSARGLDLAEALRAGRGDCTEFADLFTTLARALGIPARPVDGLVYAEVDGPGFYLHAWSEVTLDGRWVAVDPTSGQLPADATHLPFPDDPTGFLRAYAALEDMRLEVVDVEYE